MSGHITRMSRGSSVGSSCEQPDQHLAQHLDLAGRAVAGVHLDRPVVGVVATRPTGRRVVGRRSAWSQPSRVVGSASGATTSVSSTRPAEAALQLALVAAERGEQRVPDPAVAPVVARGDRALGEVGQPLPEVGDGCGSQRCISRWSAERAEQLDLGDRQPGVAEQRDPRRQFELGAVLSAGRGLGVPDAGAGASTAVGAAAARARRLPGEVARRASLPAPSVARPAASRRAAAAAGRRTTRTARPAGGRPRSGGRGGTRPRRRSRGDRGAWPASLAHGSPIDASMHRPAAARPARPAPTGPRRRVPVSSATSERGNRNSTPAQTPSPPRARRAEPVGQPLGQPPLDTPAGTTTTSGERVVQRGRQQVAERVGEQVGPRSAVEVERHRGRPYVRGPTDIRGSGGSRRRPLAQLGDRSGLPW